MYKIIIINHNLNYLKCEGTWKEEMLYKRFMAYGLFLYPVFYGINLDSLAISLQAVTEKIL